MRPVRSVLSAVHGGSRVGGTLDVFTVASDARAADLAVCLESLARFPGYRLRVIPFDDQLELVTRLCDVYGAELVRPEEEWDDLGRVIFADETTRGNQSWRYFRKFNAFSHAKGDFVFLDANVIVYDDLRKVFSARRRFDVAFGARSNEGRNFPPWSRFILRHIDPKLRDGFQAGLWCVRRRSVDEDGFLLLGRYPRIRSMFAAAPEQAVLNLGLALAGKRLRLVNDVRPDLEFLVCGKSMVGREVPVVDGTPRKGRTPLLAAKWAGDYHSGAFRFPCQNLHEAVSEKVLDRLGTRDEELRDRLAAEYADLYSVTAEA